MKKTLKETLRPFTIIAMLCICGLWIYYRVPIIEKLDAFSLSLLGKNITGRNVLIRMAVFGGLFLISLLIPPLFDRCLCRNKKLTPLADAVILGLLAVPAVQFLRICCEQMLRRDDYWEIADAREFGFPGSMIVEITRYNGRFLSWGIRSLYAVFDPVRLIHILLCANLVILTAAVALLVRQALKCRRGADNRPGLTLQSVLIACVIVTAFILLASNIWEVWFWGSGMLVYGLGITLCLLAAALVLRIAADDSLRGRHMVIPAVICFLACGCSELCTASLAAFLAVMLLWKCFISQRWDKRLLFFFAEICLSCLFIFMISGSVTSAGEHAHITDTDTGNLVSGIFGGFSGKIHWVFTALWGYTFINYRLWLVFIAVFLLIGSQFDFDGRTRKSFILIAALLVLTAHAAVFINAALDYMPPRVVTVGICWLILALLLLCFAVGSFLPGKLQGQTDRAKMAFAAFILCLISSGFYSQNIDELRTIKGSWRVRNAVLLQQTGSTEAVETCSLPNRGSFHEDILSDTEDPFNVGIARYYHVPEIFAVKRCPPYGESFTDFSGDLKQNLD